MKNQTIKVEIKNYVIIVEELKNDDPFYFVFCHKPLHRCETIFTHGWGNTWYQEYMILGGIWYKCLLGQMRRHPFHILLKDDPPTFTYPHLVSGSKYPMLATTTMKGVSKFTMPNDVW